VSQLLKGYWIDSLLAVDRKVVIMKDLAIPKALHEVFGVKQSLVSIVAILGAGSAGAMAFSLLYFGERNGLALPGLPRLIAGLLLVFDVAAGSIANFSQGTSDFYAARPRHRRVFIAIHVHLPLAAWLLGFNLLPMLAVWLYTIAAASLVNALAERPEQIFAGGVLLAIGLILVMVLPVPGNAARLLAALFLLKVLYAFAVDHYRCCRAAGAGR